MRKLLATGLAGLLAMLLLASTASAASHNPTGEFARFKECPLDRATITDCVYSVTDKGSFKLGAKTVPIVNPLILQGGFEGIRQEVEFFNAENGETLSETAQPIPGGLSGVAPPPWWPQFMKDWFEARIEEGASAVNATVELTGPSEGKSDADLSTENLLYSEGTAIGLPVAFHLENPILGADCYIGSEAEPVQIDLTSTKDGDLKGSPGQMDFNKAFTLATDTTARLVNNSFEVPKAKGCGGIFSYFIDPFLNSLLGLPSGAGENSAIFEGVLTDGQAEAVRTSE
jgi:hypothetical protein